MQKAQDTNVGSCQVSEYLMVYHMTVIVIVDHILIIIYHIIGSYSKGKGSPNQGSARVVAKIKRSFASCCS